jgi:HlyD family secretion protein
MSMPDAMTASLEIRKRVGGWNRRITAAVSIALVIAALVVWSLRPEPIAVDLAIVERGELVVTIDDEGETRVSDVYVVSAPVAGRVERITLNVGDEVIANETVLAHFQPQDPALLDIRSLSEAQAGVGYAEADLSRAAAELDYARRELRRAEQLAKQGTISVTSLDKAQLAARSALANVNQANAALTKRRADLETARAAMASAGNSNARDPKITYIPVRTPVSGKVLKRMQESAGLLAAGTPLLEIGDPAKLEIVTDLLSTDAVQVTAGDEAIIDDWGGPALKGVVRRVEPFGFTKVSALGVEEQRVNVIIDFVSSYQKWKTLGHGYRVMTRIVTLREPNTLKVPVGALFRVGADWAVFVNEGDTEGGTARLRTVKVGARNTLYAQILDGVREGDRVIVHPSNDVADGLRLKVRE